MTPGIRTKVSSLSSIIPTQFLQFDMNKSVDTVNVVSDNLVIVALFMMLVGWLVVRVGDVRKLGNA